ncbi:hypothetical protein ACTXT7_017087 [Hymenolepis weldensis]
MCFKEYELTKYQLLRYEANQELKLMLIDGMAEIFGTELCQSIEYSFRAGHRGSVTTFHGCKITISGADFDAFVLEAIEDNDLIHVYANIHANFHKFRTEAVLNQTKGPRVLVCGPANSGKSTLCKVLANYAARRGSTPILIDVNPNSNQICVPSTLAAMHIKKPYDLSVGWDLHEDPIAFPFCHLDPSDNFDLYKQQLEHLAELVDVRCENDAMTFASGCIMRMSDFSRTPQKKQACLSQIETVVDCFGVDFVIVIEDGFLQSYLKERLPREITVIRIPKSSATPNFTPDQLNHQRDLRISAYFHGESLSEKLQPRREKVNTQNVQIYQVGTEALPEWLLPQGEQTEVADTWKQVIKLPCHTDALKNRLLAASQATCPEDIPTSPVYGFLAVDEVEGQFIKVLAPTEGLPDTQFYVASIGFIDPVGNL